MSRVRIINHKPAGWAARLFIDSFDVTEALPVSRIELVIDPKDVNRLIVHCVLVDGVEVDLPDADITTVTEVIP